MKNIIKLLGIIVLAVIIGFSTAACDDSDSGSSSGNSKGNGSGSNNNITAILSSVTANGSAMQTTTQLTLTFDKAIDGLTASNITLSGVNGVSKGALSGSNPYTLPISGFASGGTLSVAVAKSGYTINGSPKTVNIFYSSGSNNNNNNITVTFNSVTTNGSLTQSTTQLTLNFNRAIDGLTADDITLSGVNGVSKGTLSGSNPYTLPISGFAYEGTLSVEVTKSGYTINGSPKTVGIRYGTEGNTPVTLNSVTADGSSTTQATTQLTLTLDKTISGLSAADIILSGVDGVSKGTLSGSNPYTLLISGFTSNGNLNVVVSKSGYYIYNSQKTVNIYYGPITLNSVTANGSSTQNTTQLTLVFDKAVPGLSAADISLSGVSVSKGELSGSNPYTMPISFYSNGTLSVGVTKSGYTINGSPKAVDIYYYYNLVIDMVRIPGGSFFMGSDSGGSFEKPVHTVTLSSFYMGKYQVTQEQWAAVMGSNPSGFASSPASGEVQSKRPVENVSWYDTLVFCNKLSMLQGLSPAYRISGSTDPADWGTVNAVEIVAGSNGYRLPTEAQWEYAARGGYGSPGNYTYSGSNNVDDVAWYASNSSSKTHEVGKKTPNGLGLYDMSGNVWEWCWDRFDSYSSGAQTDPTGPTSGSTRVFRGGSCSYDASCARSTYRNDYYGNSCDYPSNRSSRIGFRLIRP